MEQKLKFITCSGANEFTNITDLVSLSEKFPMIEWGIQVSGKKCGQGSARLAWIQRLHHCLRTDNQKLQMALHINADWVDGFTAGELPTELISLLRLKNIKNAPFFGRVQLNFKLGRDKAPYPSILVDHMRAYGDDRRFIFSFNEENKEFIHFLYRKGLRDFDVLYDSSHGEGLSAHEWLAPAFFDYGVLQGYAGGLSPDNVMEKVVGIRSVVPYNRSFYIDAEGRLKGDDKHLSLVKCEQYVVNALKAMSKI